MSWNRPHLPLILASQSPRRAEILSLMGLSFTAQSPKIENETAFLDPEDIEGSVKRLAAAKAETVAIAHPEALVLGSDTIVCIDGLILEKPTDRTHAVEMLTRLRGRTHAVYTGIALIAAAKSFVHTAVARTDVVFRNYSNEEIDGYLATDEYVDKAGSYAIQGRGLTLVEAIHGCYYAVMGLPTALTIEALTRFSSFSAKDR